MRLGVRMLGIFIWARRTRQSPDSQDREFLCKGAFKREKGDFQVTWKLRILTSFFLTTSNKFRWFLIPFCRCSCQDKKERERKSKSVF